MKLPPQLPSEAVLMIPLTTLKRMLTATPVVARIQNEMPLMVLRFVVTPVPKPLAIPQPDTPSVVAPLPPNCMPKAVPFAPAQVTAAVVTPTPYV
jgi:hypothetical protein